MNKSQDIENKCFPDPYLTRFPLVGVMFGCSVVLPTPEPADRLPLWGIGAANRELLSLPLGVRFDAGKPPVDRLFELGAA